MKKPEPWYIKESTFDEFLFDMLELGKPLDVSLVGVFETESGIRGSLRDIELPLHRDGEYSAALAKKQGGTYIEQKNIHYVGMYCMRENLDCTTFFDNGDSVILRKGQGLVWDNRLLAHGRKGPVGDRLCMRVWIDSLER